MRLLHLLSAAAVACAGLAMAIATPADAVEKQVWGFVRSGAEARLFYGVPDSGNLTIAFVCQAKRVTQAKRITIVSTVLPRQPRKGQAIRTTLSNGTTTVTHDGKIGQSESEGFYVDISKAAGREAIDVLKAGTSLSIAVPGREQRLMLRGVSRPLGQFETACFGNSAR